MSENDTDDWFNKEIDDFTVTVPKKPSHRVHDGSDTFKIGAMPPAMQFFDDSGNLYK